MIVQSDILVLFIAYVYIFFIIILAILLQKYRGVSSKMTRHIIHIFAGNSILLLPLFSTWWYPFTIPVCLAFIVALGFTFKVGDFLNIMVDNSYYSYLHRLGPLYYIISIGLLVTFTWNFKIVGMAAVLIMAWGDGSAAALTSKIKHRHKFPFSDKTVEGSLIMFLSSILGICIAYLVSSLTGSFQIKLMYAVTFILTGALVGTVTEALSIGPLKPFDNFTVPILSALALSLLY